MRIKVFVFIFFGYVFLFIFPCHAVDVTFSWKPSDYATGYRLHYGFQSRKYLNPIDVGNQTTYTMSDLEGDIVYCFAVTAYDHFERSSDYSKEICTVLTRSETDPIDSDNDGYADEIETLSGSDCYDHDSFPESFIMMFPASEDTTSFNFKNPLRSSVADGIDFFYTPDQLFGINNDPYDTSDPFGFLDWIFSVPLDGWYVIAGETYSPNAGSNSFWVRVHTEDFSKDTGYFNWNIPINSDSNEWTWSKINDFDYGFDPVYFYLLSDYQYQLKIVPREDGACIRRIAICDNINFDPNINPDKTIAVSQAEIVMKMRKSFDLVSNKEYAWVPDQVFIVPLIPSDNYGWIKFPFQINNSEINRYFISAEVMANSGGNNSFWIKIYSADDEGGEFDSGYILWEFPISAEWLWSTLKDSLKNPEEFNLASGNYILKIVPREDGTKISKISIKKF